MEILDKIRIPEKKVSMKNQIIVTAVILLSGICAGTFSKFLDGKLPAWLYAIDRSLDFHNFLGGFAPWIVIGVCISVYSCTPVRASINVFMFFLGMVSGYYIYCNFVAGFFPKSYAMIWFGITVISPAPAFICWYARGKGKIAFIVTSGIIGVLINTAFAYGMYYLDIRSWLNILMLISGIVILYKSPGKTASTIGLGVIWAIFIKTFIPFQIW